MAIDRDKVLQTAAKLVDKKKYDKAIVEYRKIVQSDPNDSRTLLKIGDLQSRMGDYASAIATYDKVATKYATQGFQLKAIAVFKQIRELIRKHAPELQARYSHVTPRLADIYAELNLVTDALAAYDEVATMYQKAGRDRDAIAVFEKTVQLDPKNPLPHLRLAEARCRVKQLDEAIDSFWTASELLLGLKRPDDALKVIERILHFRQDPIYARAAAQLYLKKGTAQAGMQALARLQIAFQANPKDLDTLALLAQAFEVIQQSDKALEVHLEMGRLARDQGRVELWGQIMAHLRHVAPHHPQVIALDRTGPPAPSQPPPAQIPPQVPAMRERAPSVEVTEVEEYDEVSDVSDVEAYDLGQEVEYIDDDDGLENVGDRKSATMRASRPPSVSSPSIRGSQPDLEEDEGVEVGDSDYIDAEERRAPQSFQPSSHAHKALADAESFRGLGLLDKAVEALHIALEIDPNSIPIREKLREILVEAGEREGAIQETLNIAIIHIHNQNPSEAEPLALEVLEIEPDHPDALNILDHVAVLRDGGGAATEEGGLSSYDMEGVRPSAAINDFPSAPGVPSFSERDYSPDRSPLSTRSPLSARSPLSDVPSWDAGGSDFGPASSARVPPPPRSVAPPALPPPSAPSLPAPPPPSSPSRPAFKAAPAGQKKRRPSAEAIEEVLEEAEFFASQGLYSDAEAILADMLTQAPDHILLREQLNEVRAAQASGDFGEERDSLAPEDHSFDIAASLDALDDLDEPNTSPAMSSHEQEVDVDQVFAKFKEGVKAVVDDSDAATHYDLGLAYKEMGLHIDAISEFEIASKDPARMCNCYAMIGMTYKSLGDTQKAKEAFLMALSAEQKTADQEKAVEYDLAMIHEAQGSRSNYLKALKSLAAKDPGYRDVAARIRALGEVVPRADQDDEDEFDAAFNNLLG